MNGTCPPALVLSSCKVSRADVHRARRSSVSRAGARAYPCVRVFRHEYVFLLVFFELSYVFIGESTVRLIADTSTRIAHVYTCVYYSTRTVAPKLQLTFEGTFVPKQLESTTYFRTFVLSKVTTYFQSTVLYVYTYTYTCTCTCKD